MTPDEWKTHYRGEPFIQIPIANRLVVRARTFIGVPYRHRGRTAAGLDCAGLPWLSYAEEGVILPDLKKYGRTPFDDGLMRAAADALGEPIWTGVVGQVVPRELLKVGDVVVLRFVLEPHHMAIVGDDIWHGLSLIHANGQPGVSRVVEHGLTEPFLKMIAAVFRRPIPDQVAGDYSAEDVTSVLQVAYSFGRPV